MVSFVLILLLFLMAGIFALLRWDENERYRPVLFVFFWFSCVAIAGLREVGSDRDSIAYWEVFNNNNPNVLVEYSFHLISSLVKSACGADFLFVLLAYALIGVTLKFIAIRQLTNLWMLSCMIYLANIYILQDMTQIRIGIATGMFLLSIKPLYERNLKLFLLFSLIGAFFHMAALLILPLWFLNSRSFDKPLYLVLVIWTYCLFFMGLTATQLIGYIPIDYIQEKMRLNQEAAIIKGEMITPFTIMQLLRIGVAIMLSWKLERLLCHNRYLPLLLKIYILSIISFLLFADIPVLSVRFTEFLGCIEIILIPSIVYTFKNRGIGIGVPIGIGIFLIYMNLFYHKLIIY